MKLTLAAFAALTILSSVGYAESIEILDFSNSGSGCREDGDVDVSEIGKNGFEVVFNGEDFFVETSRKTRSRFCTVKLEISIPEGFKWGIYSTTFVANYALEEDAKGRMDTTTWFSGSLDNRSEFIGDWIEGEFEGSELTRASFSSKDIGWSECADDSPEIVLLNLKNRLVAKSEGNEAAVFGENGEIIFEAKLEKCD